LAREDPIGLAGGVNLHGYVSGNPIALIDPDGLDGVSDVLTWGGLASSGLFTSEAVVATLTAAPGAAVVGAAGVGVLAGRVIGNLPIGRGRTVDDFVVDAFTSLLFAEEAAPDASKRHTPDQEAAVELAKEALRKGGLSKEEAEALVDLAKGTGLPARGPEFHPKRPIGKEPHIHVDKIDHIPVLPSVAPSCPTK
jgi:hypothetical protein